MSFRDQLLADLQSYYVNEEKTLQEGLKVIKAYFTQLKFDMGEINKFAKGEVSFNIGKEGVSLTIRKNNLTFTLEELQIHVMANDKKHDSIIASENSCLSKKHNTPVNEDLINQYLEVAFREWRE